MAQIAGNINYFHDIRYAPSRELVIDIDNNDGKYNKHPSEYIHYGIGKLSIYKRNIYVIPKVDIEIVNLIDEYVKSKDILKILNLLPLNKKNEYYHTLFSQLIDYERGEYSSKGNIRFIIPYFIIKQVDKTLFFGNDYMDDKSNQFIDNFLIDNVKVIGSPSNIVKLKLKS